MLGATPEEVEVTRRAAELSKSDLVTNMVVEMTSLRGIMGEIYAERRRAEEVGQAGRSEYLPRYTGDDVPASLPGLALSLADKLDSGRSVCGTPFPLAVLTPLDYAVQH